MKKIFTILLMLLVSGGLDSISQTSKNALPAGVWNNFLSGDAKREIERSDKLSGPSRPSPSVSLRSFSSSTNTLKSSKSDVLLFENFDGEELPSGWGVFQLGDDNAPGWEFTTLEPRSGSHHLVHNFSPTLSSDSWLVLPALEIPHVEDIGYFLSFYQRNMHYNFYKYSGIYISTQSADPQNGHFEPVLEADIDIPGWTVGYVDLNSYAGQQIFIAFRYKGADGHTYYLDEISVFGAPVVNGGFYMQDFSQSQFPPDAWSMYAQQPEYGWQRSTSSQLIGTANAHHGKSLAGIVSNSWLYSPRFFLPEAKGVRYELLFHERTQFMHLYDHSTVRHVKSEFFLDIYEQYGDFTTELLYESNAALGDWTQTRVDLSGLMNIGLNFAFRYRGENAHVWAIDNLRLEAVFDTPLWTENFGPNFPLPGWRNNGWLAPKFIYLTKDQGDEAIDYFIYSSNEGDFFFTPLADIPDDNENYMLKVNLAAVPYFDTGFVPDAQIEVWALDQKYLSYELYKGSFSNWDWKEIWIPVNELKGKLVNFYFVNSSLDADAGIRINSISLDVVPDKDAAVISLDTPHKGQINKPFQFTAQVRNMGYNTEDLPVNLTLGMPGQEPLVNSLLLTDLVPGEVMTVSFDNYISQFPGFYSAEARVILLGDEVPENNSIEKVIEMGEFPHALALEWDFQRERMNTGYFLLDQSDFPFLMDDEANLPFSFGGTWDGKYHWIVTAENQLIKLDDHSGVVLQTLPILFNSEHEDITFVDLSYHWQQQKLFILSVAFTGGNDLPESALWEVDEQTGNLELVFALSGRMITSIALDNYGELFALERAFDETDPGRANLLKLDPSNGQVLNSENLNKKVFPQEPLNFLHFNHGNNTLYHAAMLFLYSSEDHFHGLYTIDTQTAGHQKVGELGQVNELYAFGFAVAEIPAYFLGFTVTDENGNFLKERIFI